VRAPVAAWRARHQQLSISDDISPYSAVMLPLDPPSALAGAGQSPDIGRHTPPGRPDSHRLTTVQHVESII